MQTSIKDKILDVAERLFLMKGINSTGVADIAEGTGISKGTLYYHYPSKDAIIDDVATRYFIKSGEAISQLMDVLDNASAEDSIATCLNVIKFKKTTEKLHYTLMTYGVISYPPLKKRFAECYDKWTNEICATMERHGKSEYNIVVSNIILAIFDGLAIKNMLGLSSILDDVEAIVRMFKAIS